MAAIHLAFDIDPDVYPELHAMLSAMGSDAARGERFRQLAATGLVWETVRVRGYPVSVALAVLEDEARAQEALSVQAFADDGDTVDPVAAADDPALGAPTDTAAEFAAPLSPADEPFTDEPVEGVAVAEALANVAHAPALPQGRAKLGTHPEPMTLQDAEAALPEFAPRDDGFVDLAIDANPEPLLEATPPQTAPVELDDPVSFERAVQQAAREVPVLLDVVDPLDVPLPLRAMAPAPDPAVTPAAADAPARGRKARATSPVALVPPSPAPATEAWPDTHQALDAASGEPVPQAPAMPAAEPRAPRSRLLRMKEKGLFKNG